MSTTWPAAAEITPETAIRDRLLAAMNDCVVRKGYRETTVADIVRVARTSRRSFYQEFADKEEIFVTLLREANLAMVSSIETKVDRGASWSQQVRQAVTAYIEINDAHPELTLSWIRELPALGATATEVKNEAMESWIGLFTDLTSTPEMAAVGIEPMSRERAVVIWGGIRELTASVVETGGSLAGVVEPAVAACIALLRPPDESDLD